MFRRVLIVVLVCAAWAVILPAAPRAWFPADTLPDKFTDQEFWKLSDDFSDRRPAACTWASVPSRTSPTSPR
jgi:hypothetical protein